MVRTTRRWITGLAWLTTVNLLMFYGLPGLLTGLLLITLGIYFFRAGAVPALAITLSLVGATLLCAMLVKLTGLADAIYYRPHERLVTYDFEYGHRAYRRNKILVMRMPHGDLQALTGVALTQPRQVRFQTDSEGFRNEKRFAGERFFLIGDSFVAGLDNSQEDILSSQLASQYGMRVYNLGHPGDISDYLTTVRAFRKRHPDSGKGVLFLFEGNDFTEHYESAEAEKLGRAAVWLKRYHNLFTGTDLFRVTESLSKRALSWRKISRSSGVKIHDVGGMRMGFYAPYVEVTQRQHYAMPLAMQNDLRDLVRDVEHIFFIPDKYRVYAPLIGAPPLPHAQWQALSETCARYRWHCTDITPDLVDASKKLLETGEFTWWLDDTHWNKHGIAVAARVVAGALGEPQKQ